MCRKTALTLLFHGSPLFEGYKSSVLIMVPTNTIDEIMCDETILLFREKGFELQVLGQCLTSTRILIFNRKALEEDVYSKDRFSFLQSYGYSIMPLDSMLKQLTKRLDNCNVPFPHEIGIFLGYPLEDIKGFINNKAQNYSYSGYWKVYSNQEKTRLVFDNYRKSREKNLNKYIKGVPFEDILEGEKIV